VHGIRDGAASQELYKKIGGAVEEIEDEVDQDNELDDGDPVHGSDRRFQLGELHSSEACEPWLQV
jgi:hypothetical protein